MDLKEIYKKEQHERIVNTANLIKKFAEEENLPQDVKDDVINNLKDVTEDETTLNKVEESNVNDAAESTTEGNVEDMGSGVSSSEDPTQL